jgi:hypothetical protein
MRIISSIGALAAIAALAACDTADERQTASHHGRYLGIGVYEAGRMWSRMVRAAAPADPAAATLADDERVIVVVDSHSGEVRQCGNLTGHCIGMNPWRAPLGQGQGAPIPVTEHAADLDRAAEAETANAAMAATEENQAAGAPAR